MLKVRQIHAEPGQKAFGFIEVCENPVFPIRMPVGLVSGAQSGPLLLITAGIHGSEYPGIEAAVRTLRDLDPSSLRGNVIIIPCVNTPGFEAGSANTNPIDGLNMNRIFPGSRDGTASHRMCRVLVEEFGSIADYVVDLHGGDLGENLRPFVIYHRTGNADVDAKAEGMARAYGVEFLWELESDVYEGTFVSYLAHRGIPAIVGEAGGLGTYKEEDISVHVRGINNVLKYLGMLSGRVETSRGSPLVFHEWFTVSASRGGIVYPLVGPGDEVRKGQVLAEVRDLQGNTLERLVAPANGFIRVHFPKRVVSSGQPVYRGWVSPADRQ